MKLEDLGMTEGQAVEEILTMREFNNFIEDRLGEKYFKYVNEFSRSEAEKALRGLGASESEIKEACDFADRFA